VLVLCVAKSDASHHFLSVQFSAVCAMIERIRSLLSVEDFLPAYTQKGWHANDVGPVPYLALTLLFTAFMYVLEAYLDLRQLRAFTSTKALPKELVSHISEETFRKSNAYNKDKFAFKMIESAFSFIQTVSFMALGYLPYTWDLSMQIAERIGILDDGYSNMFREIVVTWIFIVIMTVVDTVLSTPFSLYSTFVVEEKHGFNKTTLALFIQDKLMTLGLTFLLGMPILSAVVYIIRIGGPHFYYYVWACLCVVSIILMTIYPTMIAPLFNKYTPLEDGEVKTAIEELASSVNFPLTKLFTVDGSRRSAHSNAYFYGFFKVGDHPVHSNLMLTTVYSNLVFFPAE
jgi:STE24 endopeptidase